MVHRLLARTEGAAVAVRRAAPPVEGRPGSAPLIRPAAPAAGRIPAGTAEDPPSADGLAVRGPVWRSGPAMMTFAQATEPPTVPAPPALSALSADRPAPAPAARLTFRHGPQGASADLERQVLRIERQVRERVVRDVPPAAARQAAPPATALAPQLLRSLTEQVCHAVERRMDIERYRRGR